MRHLNDAERHDLVELLSALIRIDSSVSSDDPMESVRVEERMAAFVADRLRAMGMEVETYLYQPGRPNLVAHWGGQGGPRSLMLEAHMDTVGVAGMTAAPFDPVIRAGRLYGRGACDTKGSLAAFMTALELASRADRLPADKLYFVAAAAEETGCRGAAALMEQGFRTDAAIVGEPTRCRAVTCHKGPLWMEVVTRGRACHASQPEHGRNAIERMGRVLAYIHGPWQDYIRQVEHPLLGRSTSQATLIAGGSKVNIIPAECRLQVDSRFVPWQPSDALVAAFRRGLAEYLGDADFEIGSVEAFPALDTPANIPVAARLLGLCEVFNGQSGPEGVTYFADSGRYAAAGIASVLFGPGDIAQAHTADEFIAIDQLVQGSEIILNLLLSHAGRSIVADD